MPSLTDFLLARIAEDEAVARAAREHEYLSAARDASPLRWVKDPLGYGTIWVNSGRVLAECEAKRRIVTALAVREEFGAGLDSPEDKAATWALRESCKALAVVYADRPGYREEWRP
jgi:hypothetical protein